MTRECKLFPVGSQESGKIMLSIESIIHDFLYPKPRLLCICGKFRCGEGDGMEFYRCLSCGGWMSRKRMVEKGLIRHILT